MIVEITVVTRYYIDDNNNADCYRFLEENERAIGNVTRTLPNELKPYYHEICSNNHIKMNSHNSLDKPIMFVKTKHYSERIVNND